MNQSNSSVAVIALIALLFAWRPAVAQVSAHALVDASIQSTDRKPDLRKVERLSFKVKLLNRDVVEGEHDGEPYVVTMGAGTITDDLSNGYRMLETKNVDSGALVSRQLTLGPAEEFDVLSGGKVSSHRAALSSPAWELRNPFRALRLADRAADLRQEPNTMLHGARQEVVSFQLRGVHVRVLLDARTKLITATEAEFAFTHTTSTDIAYNAMGDVTERTEFMLWEDTGGLRYPTQWDTYRNGVLLQTLTVDDAPTLDAPWNPQVSLAPDTLHHVALLAATDLDRAPLNQAILGAPDPHRGIEEIAPGIVQIPGSWYTTLVRQNDGIVVIDAPISAGYSAQVIAECQRRFPGMPIKGVITSTAFFWHVGGVRDANEDTLRRILAANRKLAPDRLALHPTKPVLRRVSDRTEIGKGRNRIILMPISLATEPMLMTYIPDAGILHTGEMIQPLGPGGSFLHPESLLEIWDSVAAEHLKVDRLIGMHMSPRPWGDLQAAIAKAGT